MRRHRAGLGEASHQRRTRSSCQIQLRIEQQLGDLSVHSPESHTQPEFSTKRQCRTGCRQKVAGRRVPYRSGAVQGWRCNLVRIVTGPFGGLRIASTASGLLQHRPFRRHGVEEIIELLVAVKHRAQSLFHHRVVRIPANRTNFRRCHTLLGDGVLQRLRDTHLEERLFRV